jgi:RNA polymerase primary sigma factor
LTAVAVNRARDGAPHGDEPDPSPFAAWQTRGGAEAHLREPGGRPPLTREEEVRLAEAARLGDRQAAVSLVEANLRLAIAVARRYRDRGVPFMDLVQEGNLGLMRAVDGFDPSRDRDFATYAYWCVREAVRETVARRGWLVPMPSATLDAIDRLARVDRRLTLELGREPTGEEMALELGMGTRRLATLRRLASPPVSLELEPGGGPLDATGDGDGPLPPDDLLLEGMRVDVHAILAVLRPRERRVLQLRYGLMDGRRRTPEEIGRRLGLTRQRICQIERLALEKVRRAGGRTSLAGNLD